MKSAQLRRPAAVLLLLGSLAVLLAGCGDSSVESTAAGKPPGGTTIVFGARHAPPVPLPNKGQVPKRLVVKDLRPGRGVEARRGDLLTTKFVAVRTATGKPFESTWEAGNKPFSFQLGADQSSPGWEKGLPGMRVGGRRELSIPPSMISRFTPFPESAREDALTYVVELIGVAPPELAGRHEPNVVVPPGPPPKHLRVRDLIKGRGPEAKPGDLVTMRYVSKHYTGKPFSNSWDDGHPFRIHLGAGTFKSIPGWEKGLPGMRVGGRREIIVPPDLIYQGGAPPSSSPSETLVYLIDLFGITEPR